MPLADNTNYKPRFLVCCVLGGRFRICSPSCPSFETFTIEKKAGREIAISCSEANLALRSYGVFVKCLLTKDEEICTSNCVHFIKFKTGGLNENKRVCSLCDLFNFKSP